MDLMRKCTCVCLLAAVLLFGGCAAEDSEVVSLRKDFVLNAEPADATTIEVAKNALETDYNVSIVAQISSDETKAFVKGQAAFLITEVGDDSCQTGECVDCPFCDDCGSKKTREAAVQFIDESGEPLAVDARDLLGVQPGDVVVIQGKGQMMPGLDMLQISAEHIFVRSKEVKAN